VCSLSEFFFALYVRARYVRVDISSSISTILLLFYRRRCRSHQVFERDAFGRRGVPSGFFFRWNVKVILLLLLLLFNILSFAFTIISIIIISIIIIMYSTTRFYDALNETRFTLAIHQRQRVRNQRFVLLFPRSHIFPLLVVAVSFKLHEFSNFLLF